MKVGPLFLILGCGALTSCATSFPQPMTAAQLTTYDATLAGPALVAYLSQSDASPTVCDLTAKGPHVASFSEIVRDALVDGLTEGKIAPELWSRCAKALLKSAPRDDAASFIDAVGKAYRGVMKSDGFETSVVLQKRLQAMQQFYIDRKNQFQGHAAVDDKLIADLRKALANHRLGPIAAQMGEELVSAVELEHGLWMGRTVDVPLIDSIYAQKDEQTLLRFGNRLPSADLREAARRRVVRLHIAASPFPEVRANAAAIEEIVMKQGVNAISLTANPIVRGWIDTTKVPMRGVLVRQQLQQQTATLLGYSGDRPGVSVLPELKLRGALLVQAKDISQPITLCAPGQLDPTPCISVQQVKLDNPDAYLDKGGAFHFVDHIYMRDAVNLAQMRDKFVLPVSIGGQRLCSFEWQLYYERPDDLVFNGSRAGGNGPNLGIAVDYRDPLRFIYTVSSGGVPYLAVVERADASLFHVVSRGAAGASGSAGSDGATGSSGSECGDGGPGGNGGDIAVNIACGAVSCPDVVALLRQTIVSVAGPGGAGGAGGSGGSGRSPTTHTDSDGNTVTDDPGCSAGSNGSSGNSGSSGSDGPPGQPGHTRFVVVPPKS